MEPQKWKNGYLEKVKYRDGEWWVLRYRDGDKRPRKRVIRVSDCPSERQAEKAARHVRDEINKPTVVVRLFGDVITRYLNEEIPKRFSTQRGYRKMLRLYIEPKWADKPLEEVKAQPVRKWLNDLPMATRSRGHLHGLMKRLFRFAQLWEWYDPKAPNPMSHFSIEGASKRKKEPRVLTPAQAEALAAELQEPYRSMFVVDLLLGLRCSELTGLKWEDIDFLGEKITVKRSVVEGRVDATKTPESKAELPMHPKVAETLKRYRTVAIATKPHDWVFAAVSDPRKPVRPYNIAYYKLRPAAKKVGVPFTFGWHALRHTYKTWMDGLCDDPAIKMHLMRHADIRTTENVYGRAQMEKMRELNAKVAELVRL